MLLYSRIVMRAGGSRHSHAGAQSAPCPFAQQAALGACVLALLVTGCDESETDLSGNGSFVTPPGPGFSPAGASTAGSGPAGANTAGTRDLGVLGSDANANQQAFRARFGLHTPTADELAGMTAYQARLTVYSDADPDWPSSTVALQSWRGGADESGNPLGIDGTTAAVDFRRVPPHSLLYIPATDQFVEAIDTGATNQWARDDAGKSDYGAGGLGRIDIQSSAQGRSSQQVERQFETWIGPSDYGQVYIVARGGSWKNSH
jgi:hypothetical protein